MAATAWATIQEAIRAVETTIGEAGIVTQGIGSAIVVSMGSMAEAAGHMNARIEQVERVMNATSLIVNGELKSLNDRLDSLQSIVESSRDGQARRKYGILESKSAQSVKTLGSDMKGLRMWNEKLVNIVSQIRPGSRRLLSAIGEFIDRDNGLDESVSTRIHGQRRSQEHGRQRHHIRGDERRPVRPADG